MKIIVPMAGRGSRMQSVRPKPLIEVAGRPMVAWAWDSVANIPHSSVTFVALRDHDAQFDASRIVRELAGAAARVVLLDDVTEGQLCTVLAAREALDADEDVLIAASDTIVESDIGRAIAARRPEVRGLISVLPLEGDRWSFARTDASGRVVAVAEKERISSHASTGLYYFASGRELLGFADAMIAAKQRTRGEYYVMPVYQRYIEAGLRIELDHATRMHDLGTPEALASFERLQGKSR